MFRNIGFGAAAVLAAGALAIGCSDDGDTIVGGGTLTTDNYPGSQVQESNVADDGRAFTNQGQNAQGAAEIYWNVSNGTAIALYVLETATFPQDQLLYAAYWNGNSWATPVQIRGADGGAFEDPQQAVQGFKALWINTAGSTIPEAAARNGDAIILFTRADMDPNVPVGSTTQEDSNIRLWMSYFDVSAAALPASGDVVRGFNTAAITVDEDNTFTGVGSFDPGVSTFGFVSNSLDCAHEFTAETDMVDSGQPTDFVSIVYRKDTGTTTPVGSRYRSKSIVGDAVDNTLANLLDVEEVLTPGVGTLATGDSVGDVNTNNDFFTVYDAHMFWQSTIAVVSSTVGSEFSTTVTRFNEDGVESQINLGPAPIANQAPDIVFVPRAAHVYGGDHGLASTDVIFRATGFITDQNPSTGDTADDVDLYVARIDNEDTLARELVQVDNFSDTIDNDGTGVQFVGRSITNVDTRINRTGQFITVLFNQANTDASTDATPAAIHDNTQLYVTVIQTRRTNVDPLTGVTPARDLDVSVFDLTPGTATIFEPRRAPAALATGLASANGDEPDVSEGSFQQELAGGQATSQADDVSCDLGCVIQSNSNRVNFLYTQMVDIGTSGTNLDEDRLLVSGIEVDLGDTDVDAPTFELVNTSEVVVASRDIDYGADFSAFAMDAGDVTRDNLGVPSGDSGRPLVFYVLNQNNPTDNTVSGAFTETRAFVWDGASELLSTDDAREFGQVDDLLGAITVAKNEDITGSPHHSGSTIHVYMIERVDNGTGNRRRLVTRSYNKGAINDSDTANDTLENRFTPNLVGGTAAGDPVQIDQLTDGPLDVLGDVQVLSDGTTVGVYFDEDLHIYYTDTASDALGYDSLNGVPEPQLVDNDSDAGNAVLEWDIRARPVCDQLPKSMVIFVRDDDNTNGNFNVTRAYVRVHN